MDIFGIFECFIDEAVIQDNICTHITPLDVYCNTHCRICQTGSGRSPGRQPPALENCEGVLALLEQGIDLRCDGPLWNGADHLINDDAALEQCQRRYAHDTIASGNLLILVHVQTSDLQLCLLSTS